MQSETYTTSDLGAVAYLMCAGHKLLRIDPGRDEPHRKWFVFEAGARADARAYFDGAQVVARQFNDALRQIKAKLYGRI